MADEGNTNLDGRIMVSGVMYSNQAHFVQQAIPGDSAWELVFNDPSVPNYPYFPQFFCTTWLTGTPVIVAVAWTFGDTGPEFRILRSEDYGATWDYGPTFAPASGANNDATHSVFVWSEEKNLLLYVVRTSSLFDPPLKIYASEDRGLSFVELPGGAHNAPGGIFYDAPRGMFRVFKQSPQRINAGGTWRQTLSSGDGVVWEGGPVQDDDLVSDAGGWISDLFFLFYMPDIDKYWFRAYRGIETILLSSTDGGVTLEYEGVLPSAFTGYEQGHYLGGGRACIHTDNRAVPTREYVTTEDWGATWTKRNYTSLGAESGMDGWWLNDQRVTVDSYLRTVPTGMLQHGGLKGILFSGNGATEGGSMGPNQGPRLLICDYQNFPEVEITPMPILESPSGSYSATNNLMFVGEFAEGYEQEPPAPPPPTEHGVLVRGKWQWTSSGGSSKWTPPQQGIRLPRLSEERQEMYDVYRSRLKIRGRGESVAFSFTSEPGKDFVLLGWAVRYKGETDD